jgi:hypothetical protein
MNATKEIVLVAAIEWIDLKVLSGEMDQAKSGLIW